jgi:uncharacterized Zn finger protein (UPF0148 family)
MSPIELAKQAPMPPIDLVKHAPLPLELVKHAPLPPLAPVQHAPLPPLVPAKHLPPPLRDLGYARPRRLLGLRSMLNATCEPCPSTHFKNASGNEFCARCPDGMYSLDGIGCVFVPFNTTTTAPETTPQTTTTLKTNSTTPAPGRRASTTPETQSDSLLIVIGVVSALLALGCGGAILWVFCIKKRDRHDKDEDKEDAQADK